MDLKKLFTPWAIILQHYHNGKRIERADIVAALESNAPVPDYAKPLLSEIISGKYRFIRGLKPDARFESNISRHMIASLVDATEAAFNSGFADIPEEQLHPDIKERADQIRKNLKGETARESAKELVSSTFGISIRKLEKILKKEKAGAQ